MTNDTMHSNDHKNNCITDEELYLYVTRRGSEEKLHSIETHIAECPDCRRALADTLELLSGSSEQAIVEIPEPSKAEIENTIGLIHDVARKERFQPKKIYRRLQWPIAAAMVLGLASLAFWNLNNYNSRSEAEGFYLQAKANLEQRYAGKSPNNLRLDLPFTPTPRVRNIDEGDVLGKAERYFYQALAIRENLVEAYLGIASVCLTESRFKDAREAFQQVLDTDSGDIRARIGRGVALYEEALQSDDPVQYSSLLAGALADFNEVLRNDPGSLEARYNLAWTLYESGSSPEALNEIELYLSRDGESNWAKELKGLSVRIRAENPDFVAEELKKAALTRDPSYLEAIARFAPYRMPAEIWSTLRRSLKLEQTEAAPESPGAEDLRWVAGVMESAYQKATGDASFEDMIHYHDGLSPTQRAKKKTG